MAVLKCRMCGGVINNIDSRIGECDSCGSKVLLPVINEERILNLYNRGNHFRELGEYDRAYSAYETIIAENRNDVEAHWCLMLCRYGVNYVFDKSNGKFQPTISRMNRTPILEDPDYLAVMRFSDEAMKAEYRALAKQLSDMQEQFLRVVKKEKAYDVFICFKAEDESGCRTKASEIGQNIYEELTAKGLRVFFSRITLEDKIGQEYEPYIFSALYTAKVMLVVADNANQLTARWVKNEWIRFLAMMDNNSEKFMIPVFSEMNPYDFPPEIPMVQGQDMGKLGAMQDLTRNVLYLCGKSRQSARIDEGQEKTTVDVNARLRRILIFMEDGEYDESLPRLAKVLELEPENGEAWYYSLLANNHVSDREHLMAKGYKWPETEEFQSARRYGNPYVQNELDQLEQACHTEEIYRQVDDFEKKGQYREAIALLEKLDENDDVKAKIENFRAREERDAEHRRCLEKYNSEVKEDYLIERMKAEHPKEVNEFERRKKRFHKANPPEFLDGGMWPLLCATVLWVVVYLIAAKSGYAPDGNIIAMMAALFVFIGCAIIGFIIGSIADSFFAGIIAVGVTVHLSSKLPNNVVVAIGMIIGVAFLAVSAYSSIKSVRYNSCEKSFNKYYKTVIVPLEEEIALEIKKKWEPLVGRGSLKVLKGLNDKKYS